MSSSIELDTLLERNLGGDVRSVNGFSLYLERCVQICDVGLMVLAMVQFHDLLRDVWFQRLLLVSTYLLTLLLHDSTHIIRIRKRRK